MHMLSGGLPATAADAATLAELIGAGFFPTNAIGTGRATLPSGVQRPAEVGVPFASAPLATKRNFGMKVAGSPGDALLTYSAESSFLIHPGRICTATLRHLCTCPRTLFLASLSRAGRRLPTYRADPCRGFTPPRRGGAPPRAVLRSRTAVVRVKRAVTVLTQQRLVQASHSAILPREEKWCEVAAKRLSLGPLFEPKPLPQPSMFDGEL